MYMLASFYSPLECPVCSRELHDGMSACAECIKILEKDRITETGRCPSCYNPLSADDCEFCSGRNIFFNRHISLYSLSGTWRKLLHRWKFENDRSLFRIFIPALAETVCLLPEDAKIVYIDSGKSGYDVRAYQPCLDAEILLSRLSGIQPGGFLKKAYRGRQSERSYRDRFIKIKNSYDPSEIIFSKKYILLEDVFTTGATSNEAARILKEKGAEFVMIISLLMREL